MERREESQAGEGLHPDRREIQTAREVKMKDVIYKAQQWRDI